VLAQRDIELDLMENHRIATGDGYMAQGEKAARRSFLKRHAYAPALSSQSGPKVR
jgi:hypothetical protein